MENLHIQIIIRCCSYDELSPADRALANAAREATNNSYAPYSHFSVGAAALLENGITVSGSNQENAAYPSGLCAERTTLFYANSRYPHLAVEALAVAARNERGEFVARPIEPCGACRQVMLEVESRQGRPMRLLLCGADMVYEIGDAAQLLPLSFRADSMR